MTRGRDLGSHEDVREALKATHMARNPVNYVWWNAGPGRTRQ